MKIMKKILCTVLVVVLCLTSAPLGGFVGLDFKAAATEYQVGDIIQFGSYPQSEVKDSATITALNNKAPTWDNWISYGYYSGGYGSMVPGDWMRYTDITYNGNKYRGVKFTQYRSYSLCDTSSYTYQDDNGYYTNTTYWFKFESIDWRVLDPSTGLVMCETIIDSQPYINTIFIETNYYTNYYFNDPSLKNYATDYETSAIRKWLNNDFYDTAFTDNEKKEINTTTLNNDGFYTSIGITGYEKFDSNETKDNVFLLSYNEVRNNNYGFGASSNYDPARLAKGSDYAKSQGLYVESSTVSTYNGNSYWLLRSPGKDSSCGCLVYNLGNASCDYPIYHVYIGIRPALRCNLDKIVNGNDSDMPDNPTVPEKNKSIAILTTNKSFCVETNDSMMISFGIMREDGLLEGEWKKMALSVSDPTIVSLSDYIETEFGYSLEIKGVQEGTTNIVVTDTESGLSEEFRVTVYDSYVKSSSYSIDNVPCFYPQNKWENDIETNIYNMNGLYVNNYKCTKNENQYTVSFDVYNEKYHTGSVDIFDSNGNWIDSIEIEKYSNINSIWDTGEQAVYLVTDLFTGKLLSYEQASFAKHTPVTITVPEGGFFTISNNIAESIGVFLFNACEILYEGVSSLIDVVTADSIDVSAFSKLIKNEIVDNPVIKEEFKKIFVETVDKEIRTYTEKILKGEISDSYAQISGLFENILNSLDISWKHLFQTATGVGESIFEVVSGPVGLALKGCFAISGGTDKLLQAKDLAVSVDEVYATLYSSVDNGYINPHGVYVTNNGNIDVEAVLQVFKISNDDSISVLLDSADPLAMHELYNICFVKNDKLVQPNGKVKVHIPVPKNMKGNTCTVYRQEDDGSWTILKARKEGDYLVFETDHFSLYAIIGIRNELEINTLPDKLTYESNDKLELSGLTLKMNGEIVEEGFICNPSVMFETGKQTITVNYMGLTTEFEVTVEPHKHVLDKNGKCQKCGEDVTKNCSCNCHAGGIKKFFFKFLLFFQKIFRTNKECKCGIYHY